MYKKSALLSLLFMTGLQVNAMMPAGISIIAKAAVAGGITGTLFSSPITVDGNARTEDKILYPLAGGAVGCASGAALGTAVFCLSAGLVPAVAGGCVAGTFVGCATMVYHYFGKKTIFNP